MCNAAMGTTPSHVKQPPWVCPRCTFICGSAAPHCVMCSYARPPLPSTTLVPPAVPLSLAPVPRSTSLSHSPLPSVSPPSLNPSSHRSRSSQFSHSHDSAEDDDDAEDEDDEDDHPPPPQPAKMTTTSAPGLSDERAQTLHALFAEVCTLYRASQSLPTKSSAPTPPDSTRVNGLVHRVFEATAADRQQKSGAAPSPLPAPAKARSRSKQRKTQVVCEVCYETIVPIAVDSRDEAKRGDAELALTMPVCGHNHVCNSCMGGYLTSRISSNDVAAWLPCPHPDCAQPVPPSVLTYPGLLPPSTLLLLLQSFLLKSLARSTAFIPCTTSLCPYAFLSVGAAAVKLTCPLCSQQQTVQRGKVEELDASFKQMIKEGTLRGCPACSHYTMKEKGICNVLECAKCGVCLTSSRVHSTIRVASFQSTAHWCSAVCECRCGGTGERGRRVDRARS